MLRYLYSATEESATGFIVFSVEDVITGIKVNTILPDATKPFASITSYVAARYSRSAKSVTELLTELVDKNTDAVNKMGEIFNTYGHASVADMSGVFCYIENVPSLFATYHFMQSSVGAGMERSTRYQDFSKNTQYVNLKELLVDSTQHGYHNANAQFLKTQFTMLEKYKYWIEELETIFAKKYEVNLNDSKQKSALKARVFDTARAFLPWGAFNKTSLGYLTSAREWSRLIGLYKGSHDDIIKNIGSMLEMLLAPPKTVQQQFGFKAEVEDLIKYTKAEETTTNNLLELKKWLDSNSKLKNYPSQLDRYSQLDVSLVNTTAFKGSQKTLQGYISLIYPYIEPEIIESYILSLSNIDSEKISSIIFANHNHHNQLPIQARHGDYGFYLTCSYSEMRDLNRHRAFGRYCPKFLSEFESINNSSQSSWILSPYLESESEEIIEKFKNDLMLVNIQIKEFENEVTKLNYFNTEILKQTWLFCTNTPFYMYGSTKDVHYLTHLRVRPGGHISYRILAKKMAKKVFEYDPLMFALNDVGEQDVDPDSRSQFLDRS